jgi:hypothetical protein
VTITPIAGRPDWFVGDAEIEPIKHLPGIKLLSPGRWRLHRSHLPIVEAGVAARAATASVDDPARWAERDLHTKRLGFTLRAAQHTAIDFITQRRGTLLGDSPRIGKTLSCIMSHDPASGPLVVICPAMVRSVWVSWLRVVFPDEPIGLLSGRAFDPAVLQHKLIVGHYEILPWWQSARPIGTLVLDEAHALTNRSARRTKAAVFLASRAQRVIAATGTPIWNLPPNLWSILGLVAPDAWGGFHEFAGRYGAPEYTEYGVKYTGISHEDELQLRLSDVMIRRRWEDLPGDLPPTTRNVLTVDLDESMRRKLDLMVIEMAEDRSNTIGYLSKYRKALSNLKAKTVLAEASRLIATGEPVVVWTWHVELAEQLATVLGERAQLITGDVSAKQRDERLAAWRAAPANALICTMSVAQVGLDFSHARLAIFGEIDYTPAVLAQAEMRTFAPARPMNITYAIANHQLDRRVVLALTKKLGASTPVALSSADDAISTLHEALYGTPDVPDLDRLLTGLLDA